MKELATDLPLENPPSPPLIKGGAELVRSSPKDIERRGIYTLPVEIIKEFLDKKNLQVQITDSVGVEYA